MGINGLFFDPRAWKIDFTSSSFWKPADHGINIDFLSEDDARRIASDTYNFTKPYQFVIATEMWELEMRKTWQALRNKGIKIFLSAREPFKSKILHDGMFSHEKFKDENGKYYFTPDVVLAVAQGYADLWKDKTKTIITGYPRFDFYANRNIWVSRDRMKMTSMSLDPTKKWIFFPDYPPYTYKKVNGQDTTLDLWNARENTLKALYNFAKSNLGYQIIVKIHPASMKPFLKGKGKREVSGMLRTYLNDPDKHMVVLPDIREDGLVAKHLLINSDIVVGFASTMLMEASLINKPCINVIFDEAIGLDGLPEYDKYLPTVYNEQELHSAIKNNNKYLPASFIEKYLGKVDGKTCERICKAIKEELSNG